MELAFKKVGNSTGLIFPAALLKMLGIQEGQIVDIETTQNGELMLRLKKKPRRYTAAELNAQCDLNAPMPSDLQEWEHAPIVGSEAL